MQKTVNEPGNEGDSITGVLPNFDLEDTRRDLIAMRTRLGADTPAGHRCSNIIGQMQALKTSNNLEQRKAIMDGIKKQIMELARLSN